MIQNLAEHTHVKICMSSRPLLAFETAFKGKPGLRLQDLTFGSIQRYANIKLLDLIKQQVFYNRDDRERAKTLLKLVVKRAEGCSYGLS